MSLLGTPAEFEHNGKLYKVGPPTQFAKDTLAELLAGDAIRAVSSLKNVLSPGEYREAYDTVVRTVASGQFKTGTRGWVDALQTPDGTISFTLSLFRVHHPDMTRAECVSLAESAPDAVNAALARVAPGFIKFLLPGIPQEVIDDLSKAIAKELAKPSP